MDVDQVIQGTLLHSEKVNQENSLFNFYNKMSDSN